MIKVKRTKGGAVETKMEGELIDILEELLNATISIIETVVEKDVLDKEHVIGFIDDFAQQVKDNIKIEEDKFDYETGKNIAYTKAQSQVFRKAAEIYNEIFDRVIGGLGTISANAYVASVKCDIHAAELAGRAEISESI